MKLKLFLYFFICNLLILSSCNKDVIRGAGNSSTRVINVPTFYAIESHYDIAANISYSSIQEVKVSGYDNLLNILDIKVENGILKLKYNTAYNSIRNGNIVAEIKIPSIHKATIHGSKNISINSFTNGINFEAFIHGSGNIYVSNSKFQTTKLTIHGSGKIKAKGLEASQAEANIYGSGDIDISVSNHLKASIYGSGSIYYWGNPFVETIRNGSGKVIKL